MEQILERNPYFINNWKHTFFPLFEPVAFPVKLELSHEIIFKPNQQINEKIYLNDGVLTLLKLLSTFHKFQVRANEKILISSNLAPLIPIKYRQYFNYYNFTSSTPKYKSEKAYTFIGPYEYQYLNEQLSQSIELHCNTIDTLDIIHPIFILEGERSIFKSKLDLNQYFLIIEDLKLRHPSLTINLISYQKFKKNFEEYDCYLKSYRPNLYYNYSTFDKIQILTGKNNYNLNRETNNSHFKIDKLIAHTENFSEEHLLYNGPCILSDDDVLCIETLFFSPLTEKHFDFFYYSEELFELATSSFNKLQEYNKQNYK